jgi:hypothetical protein
MREAAVFLGLGAGPLASSSQSASPIKVKESEQRSALHSRHSLKSLAEAAPRLTLSLVIVLHLKVTISFERLTTLDLQIALHSRLSLDQELFLLFLLLLGRLMMGVPPLPTRSPGPIVSHIRRDGLPSSFRLAAVLGVGDFERFVVLARPAAERAASDLLDGLGGRGFFWFRVGGGG